MKNAITILTASLLSISCAFSQEYATFEITGVHQGKGSFKNAALSDFSWTVTGTLTGEVRIQDNEVFDDGSAFEKTFGQADSAQNLRIQVVKNGIGTSGKPLTSNAKLTLSFDQLTPPKAWGFCVVDIDVENCMISAIAENDNQVPAEVINGWLIELFDANLGEDGINIPKWDSVHAALLGSDTPDDYKVYNNLVIGGMPSSEAPAAYFMPNIPLKTLTIIFENLQDNYNTSYHFYIASQVATSVRRIKQPELFIYPLPATNVIRICVNHISATDPVIEIMNTSGECLAINTMNKSEKNMELNIGHFPIGIYFVRIHINNQIIVKKFIKL